MWKVQTSGRSSVLDRVAGQAGEPVVGVDGLERAGGRVGGHLVEHPFSELRDDLFEPLLGQRSQGTGWDMVDPSPGSTVTVGATSAEAARVKTSHSTPVRARADASSRT